MKRRAVLGAMLALGLADRASAQAYPTRPIKLVVPFTPGGVTDNIARVFCERMATRCCWVELVRSPSIRTC